MLIKFLRHGTGSAAEAAEYLLRESDYLGTEREEIEVLRGDPHEVAAVADSLEFEHTHKSGVIAWAPEDSPSRAQIERTLEEFEKTAWAGMEPDQYAWSAVLHREQDGGAHVHVLAANCELEHGRSHNIAAPGWQRLYDPLRDRPEPRARLGAAGRSGAYPAGAAAGARGVAGSCRAQGRQGAFEKRPAGTGRVPDRAGRGGEVRNRADVVEALEKLGLEVTRQGKHYVTVQDEPSGKRMRLKGGIYDEGFDAEKLGRADRGAEGRGGGDPGRATGRSCDRQRRANSRARRASTKAVGAS